MQENQVTPETIDKIARLNYIAQQRGQTLAQMALAWLLKDKRITSVLIGVSKVEQLEDCLQAYGRNIFAEEELEKIEHILAYKGSHFEKADQQVNR